MINQSSRKSLANFISNIYQSRCISNKSCIFTRVHRKLYLRQYPTVVVKPDGSTYKVRFEEPRSIIKLPIDLSTVSEEQRAEILRNRKPKKKVMIQHEEVDDYDHSQYLKILKRN